MNNDIFKTISMNGRMAYSILCVEQYLLSRYPQKDWSPLSEKMWAVTSMSWDEWAETFMEVIPQYLFEFGCYEESDFEFLNKSEYDLFRALYDGVSDGKYEDATDSVNRLLLGLYQMEEVYSYSSIPGYGQESIELIKATQDILMVDDVSLPDVDEVSFSSFEEREGWGNPFDGVKLSRILK